MINFTLPAVNEYQWRNLYLKKYGPCTYAPPMPKHESKFDPCFLEGRGKKRHSLMYESMSAVDTQATRFAEGDSYRSIRAMGRAFADAGEADDVNGYVGAPEATSGGGEALLREVGFSDHRLFPLDMFTFLENSDTESSSSSTSGLFTFVLNSEPRGSIGLPSVSSMGFNEMSIISRERKYSRPSETSEESSDLLYLQREAWQLLMDNRIMTWFEREVEQNGRVAASVQQKLLEIVTKKPDGRRDVKPRVPIADSKNLEITHEPSFSCTYGAQTSKDEDRQLMLTLEKFSPFFAAISPPEDMRRIMMQASSAMQKVDTGGTPRAVGFPIFSQYRTWREAYEFRQTWSLAPFSFFLVNDISYNQAHICALFVMLDLICKTSHTHTQDCAVGEQNQHTAIDRRTRRRRSVRLDELGQICPLLLIQQLTEDVIFVYEQSSSRTTLSMLLRVLRFLTNMILDPVNASRFLSPEALRRQCLHEEEAESTCGTGKGSFDGGNISGTCNNNDAVAHDTQQHPFVEIDGKREDALSEFKKLSTNSNGDQLAQEKDAQHSKEPENVDIASPLQYLDETTFDQLFDLAFWFVDAATANSTLQEKLNTARSSRDTKSLLSPTAAAGVVAPADRSKGANVTEATEEVNALGRDTIQNFSRAQDFEATASVVEALVRYETCYRPNASVSATDEGCSSLGPVASAKRLGKKKRGACRIPALTGSTPNPATSPGVSLFKVSLTFLATYIRIHGATWLKELLTRIFNILRRESVLLYLSDADLAGLTSTLELRSPTSTTGARRSGSFSPRQSGGGSPPSPDQHSPLREKLEKLESLICQDIQYVMHEFFSALHGKRAITRLPQAISVLLTDYCSSIHLHLLSRRGPLEASREPPAVCVKKYLAEVRHKRVVSGLALGARNKQAQDMTDGLIHSIEGHRLAKFILFDCWIIPAMNNAIAFGFLPEDASNHLRSNIDAFARYLKIIVNAPFISRKSREFGSTSFFSAAPASRRAYSGEKKIPVFLDGSSWRCNTVKLPSLINGVYNTTTGALARLAPEKKISSSCAAQSVSMSKVVLNTTPSDDISSSNDPTRETWSEQPTPLDGLNANLGLIDNHMEWEEIAEDDADLSPLQVLNIFCSRASYDTSTKIVVSEFTVSPTTAAACIGNIHSIVSGQHKCVRDACLAGTLVGRFKSSPYLTCLIGVLMHPYMVAQVAGNILHNSHTLYNALMKPLSDETLLSMMTSLIASRGNTIMMDTNQIVTAMASLPFESKIDLAASGPCSEESREQTQARLWKATARNLLERRAIETTGRRHPSGVLHRLIGQAGSPTNPTEMLRKTAAAIQQEVGCVPLCFDMWWRAMVVALTVKVMNVLEESNEKRAAQWERWCEKKVSDMNSEYRSLSAYLSTHGSSTTNISKEKLLSYARELRGSRAKVVRQDGVQPQRGKSAQERGRSSKTKKKIKGKRK